jgi:glutathione synthase/RimK-type ligase-like ATP-grasp enzyme
LTIASAASKLALHAKSALDAWLSAVGQSHETTVGLFVPGGLRERHVSSGSLWLRAYAVALRHRGIGVRFVTDPRLVKGLDLVLWRPSQKGLPSGLRFSRAASDELVRLACEIERTCPIAPSSHEILMLENKIHMHEEFKRARVHSPQTEVAVDADTLTRACLRRGFPVIIKGPFSCYSRQLRRLCSEADLDTLRRELRMPATNDIELTLRYPVLVQQFIDLRRDMRVIIVDDEIVISYWRVNPKKDWVSTASRFGSDVSFCSVPPRWRDELVDALRRLGMRWAALDVAWDKDDVNTEPYVLEVSPGFDPNPAPPVRFRDDYREYKYSVRLRDNWDLHYWDTIKRIAEKQVAQALLSLPVVGS